MMEGVATTACFHGAAIRLLDVLCEDERGRACLRSLVEALCKGAPDGGDEEDKGEEGNGEAQERDAGGVGDEAEGSQREEPPPVQEEQQPPGGGQDDGAVVAAGGGEGPGEAEPSEAAGESMGGEQDDRDQDGDDRSDDGGSDGSGDEAAAQEEEEELPTWSRFKERVHDTLRGVTAASLGEGMVAAGSDADVPPWPHPGLEPDLAKAFGLEEILGESPERQAALVAQMDSAEKRVWLNQRLFRAHQGDVEDDMQEEPLAFIECDREGCPLSEMRFQWEGQTGIADDISGIVEVRFKGESSVGSAVLREWMAHAVSNGFLTPKHNLLASNDGGRTFSLSPSRRETHPETYLLDYEIMGRFIGAALLHRVCVGLRFHPAFCRLILADNQPWSWTDDDVRAFDPLLQRNLVEYIREADAEELEALDLTFTDVQDPYADAGDGKRVSVSVSQASVDLVTGGSDEPVTVENRERYIQCLVERRLFGGIEEQTAAFLTGLHTIIPVEVFHSLRAMTTPIELQELVAGLPTIDTEDWKAHTEYGGGFRKRSRVVRWFWEAVEEVFDTEERELVLQFATGSRHTPAGGFAQLEGFNGASTWTFATCLSFSQCQTTMCPIADRLRLAGGKHLFTLYRDTRKAPTALPTAHACLCTIDLPPYESREQLVEKLRVAVQFGSVGLHDPAMAEDEEQGEEEGGEQDGEEPQQEEEGAAAETPAAD
eukprot:COSAG04_NODE_1028_length_8678_cov_2.787737_6_plen_713_part_00